MLSLIYTIHVDTNQPIKLKKNIAKMKKNDLVTNAIHLWTFCSFTLSSSDNDVLEDTAPATVLWQNCVVAKMVNNASTDTLLAAVVPPPANCRISQKKVVNIE